MDQEQPTKADTKAIVNVEKKKDGKTKRVKKEETVLQTQFFKKQPMRLWVEYSHTIPMKAYESAKVSVGLSIPVGQTVSKPQEKKLQKAYDFASEFIGDRLKKEAGSINEYLTEAEKVVDKTAL